MVIAGIAAQPLLIAGCRPSGDQGGSDSPPADAPQFALWGDSRTIGTGAPGGQQFGDMLQAALPGWRVDNYGVGGQTAEQIVGRQGGAPPLLTIDADQLQPLQPSRISAASVNIFAGIDETETFEGKLQGVAGTLRLVREGTFAFDPGDSKGLIVANPKSPFQTNIGEAARDSTMFLCAGENGVDTSRPEEIVAVTKAAVAYLAPGNQRYLVAGVTPALRARAPHFRQRYDALNAQLRLTHGRHYLDLVTPPSAVEFETVGFVPSVADRTDLATGLFPGGMFADDRHLNAAGQKVWAMRVTARVNDFGARG